jgi:arabinogalactan oligomer/maltooligosaccharide transport system substrate-binding protein
MRKSKLWMIPCLVLPVLAGCGGTSSADEVVIKIWEDESNIETVKALANDFITSYKKVYHDAPDIVLEFTAKSEKVAIEEMGTVAEAGEGPDIAAVTHDTIASGVDLQLVAPVAFQEEMKSRMTDEAINAVTYNETIYGYPITAESMTVMYDKTQITAAELESFESLKASGKKIGLQLTGDNGGYYTYGLYTDAVLFGEDGKDPNDVNIATEKSIENVTNFYQNYLSCFEDASPEVALNYVTANRIAGVITTPFLLNSMKEALGDNLAIAKLPKLDGEELRPFSGYKAYVVSRYSKNGAIAQALCEYLTNYDSQAVRLIDKGYLPASPLNATEDFIEAIEASEEASTFADSLALSTVMPNIPEMSRFWSPMNSASTNFIRESATLTKASVEASLKEVTNTILNK